MDSSQIVTQTGLQKQVQNLTNFIHEDLYGEELSQQKSLSTTMLSLDVYVSFLIRIIIIHFVVGKIYIYKKYHLIWREIKWIIKDTCLV